MFFEVKKSSLWFLKMKTLPRVHVHHERQNWNFWNISDRHLLYVSHFENPPKVLNHSSLMFSSCTPLNFNINNMYVNIDIQGGIFRQLMTNIYSMSWLQPLYTKMDLKRQTRDKNCGFATNCISPKYRWQYNLDF